MLTRTPGRELYIYWKVAAAQLPQALQAGQDLQQALHKRHPGLQARLLQRVDGASLATVMEIYAQPGGVPNSVQHDIEVQAAQHLAPLGPPTVQRHVEVFELR